MNIDLEYTQGFLFDLLPRVGQVLRRFFRSETLVSRKKGKLDYVTEADLKADEFIRNELTRHFPKIHILTEETAPKDYSSYEKKELLWVVDPLDGTTNFSRGNNNFSVSIALVSKRQTLIGAVFAPVASQLFWARKDVEGAFGNGRKIKVSAISQLNEAVVCSDWSHNLETRNATTEFFRKVFLSVRQIKILGSAATDLTLLACGGVDLYYHVHLKPWDVAASYLIAQKAGAVVTDTQGRRWNVFTPGILAANPVLSKKMLKLIKTYEKFI